MDGVFCTRYEYGENTMYEYHGTRLNSNASSGAAEANGECDQKFFPRMRHRLVVLV
jgi:hypothetical protein